MFLTILQFRFPDIWIQGVVQPSAAHDFIDRGHVPIQFTIPIEILLRRGVLRIFLFFWRNSGVLSNFWSEIELIFRKMVVVDKFVQTDWSDFVKFWIYSKIENSEKTILTVLEFYFDKFLIEFWKINKNLIKNRVFKP